MLTPPPICVNLHSTHICRIFKLYFMDPNFIQPTQFQSDSTFQDLPSETKPVKGISVFSFVIVAVVVVGSLFLLQFLLQKKSSTAPKDGSLTLTAPTAPTPLPEKKPPYVLPTGAQTYRFSHGTNVTGPKPQLVTIDPLDPRSGSTQTISVVVHSTSAVQSVVVVIGTDHQEKTLNLQLTSGDSQKGTYQGSWQIDDSYENKYSFRYILTAENSAFNNTMYVR